MKLYIMMIFASIIITWLVLDYDYKNTLVKRYNCKSKINSQEFNYIPETQLRSWKLQWGEDFDRNFQCKSIITTRYIADKYINSRN